MSPKVHPPPLGPGISNVLNASRRAVQGRRQCANNATKLLQDYRIQQVSGRDPISTEGAWLEVWRSIGTHLGDHTRDILTPRFLPQFTYINLAFSPAPDDTVSNLYKVWIAARLGLTCALRPIPLVFLYRWSSDSKLQVSSFTARSPRFLG